MSWPIARILWEHGVVTYARADSLEKLNKFIDSRTDIADTSLVDEIPGDYHCTVKSKGLPYMYERKALTEPGITRNARYVRESRQRKIDQGLKEVRLWVKPEDVDTIKQLAEKLNAIS